MAAVEVRSARPVSRAGVVRAVGLALTALALAGTAGATSARHQASAGGDWLAFGGTPDQNRHSSLTQITKSNVDQLGRLYTVNFMRIDPTVRRGEQSYPLERNGVIYMTTNDDNVWALKATTGDVIWRFQPSNVALFRNFGIVANRGVAYCDGKLFLLTLDMHIDSIDPSNGHLIKRVAISDAVPGAASNFGYSETSAPMCANHVLVAGAAGSEYGVRGFVMGWHTDLTPAWPNPYWTVPPEQQGWRRAGRLVGGGSVWTPTTIDTSTNTLYFGTGSATPLYYPQLRPGLNARTDSVISVNLQTGKQNWWQQLISHNEWAYDVSQPPLVYDAKIGGRTRHVVSVATMEGVWFMFDAKTGAPIYQRVKVIDRTEHPALSPGKPVVIYPGSIGGLNYSPASFDPATGYVFNAAAETAAVLQEAKLTKTQIRNKLVGDIFLGLENGNFGTVLQGWHDHGSVSAIDVSTGRRVWKFQTPEPERGGVTTTAGGIGFAGGGDGTLRAFDLKTGAILWHFQTGHQIAGGPAVFSVDGKEYVAITSGGTPTSSNGGVASELQVFTLGASKQESPPPNNLPKFATPIREPAAAPVHPVVHRVVRKGGPAGTIAVKSLLFVHGWTPSSNNTTLVTGRLLLKGKPVSGVRVRVDRYVVPGATDAQGRFSYPADVTLARRHVIAVASAANASVGGRRVSAAQDAAVRRSAGSFNVAYRLSGLKAKVQRNGTVLVTGRAGYIGGAAPPTVVLYTYQLTGTIVDSSGNPVPNAYVITRTQDRDFWTFSQPSNAQGRFISFYTASDETTDNPVPLAIQVAVGSVAYGLPVGVNANFPRLRSASVDIKLPASPGAPVISTPQGYAGAVYEGLLIGVSRGGKVVKPVSARWPDGRGRFSLVLPASVRGHTISFWENQRQFFSRAAARPGGGVDLSSWPNGLRAGVPQGLASLRVPKR
jgi:alcohol dehydrogenase (cytochrome c)